MLRRETRTVLIWSVCVAALTGCTPASPNTATNDLIISGQVLNETGSPEGGVWVIAESFEVIPSDGRYYDGYRKIVVTDDDGRFVIPDLPAETYDVWVRGYGLKDTRDAWARRGDLLVEAGATDVIIIAERATDPREAAEVYPASSWLSLLPLPEPGEFGGGEGTDVSPAVSSQGEWAGKINLDCMLCHQIGGPLTRIPTEGGYDAGLKKVARMQNASFGFGRESLLDALEDWGQSVVLGESVPETPARPQGMERNIVVTQWEMGDIYNFSHDLITTDRRQPTTNADGPVYMIDEGGDWLFILDPTQNSWRRKKIPIHPDGTYQQEYFGFGDHSPDGHSSFAGMYGGGAAAPHNPMLDDQGRVWLTTGASGGVRPEFCPEDRRLGSFTMYDPETEEFHVIPTCFGVHHLEFDDRGRLWSCELGWFDPSLYDPDDPSTWENAQGWTTRRIDTDGDGIAETSMTTNSYAIYPSPDGSIWSTTIGPHPGAIHRYDPDTDKHEIFIAPAYAYGPRGVTVDSKGVAWTAFSGSGHLGRFDRSRCAQTWGDGTQCPEGWTIWKVPGPVYQNFEPASPEENALADMLYFLWADRHNASGLGNDVIIVQASNSDAMRAFDPKTERWTTLRVPYPMGYYTRLTDARIDNADGGWKGRALWSNYANMTQLFVENKRGGIVKMQFRPDPLAY